MRKLVALVKRNPVRFRAVVVAVLVAAGWAAPDVMDAEVQDAVLGVVMTAAALVFGWDASRRVVLPAEDEVQADEIS